MLAMIAGFGKSPDGQIASKRFISVFQKYLPRAAGKSDL